MPAEGHTNRKEKKKRGGEWREDGVGDPPHELERRRRGRPALRVGEKRYLALETRERNEKLESENESAR